MRRESREGGNGPRGSSITADTRAVRSATGLDHAVPESERPINRQLAAAAQLGDVPGTGVCWQ